jgi:hypothetical protein
MRPPSLRLRVAIAFAVMGAALGLLLIVGIWFAAHDVSQRLMDQTLKAELEDYMARRARNPLSLPPATASLRGYFSGPDSPPDDVPAELCNLPPGQHEICWTAFPGGLRSPKTTASVTSSCSTKRGSSAASGASSAYLLAAGGC